jgi:hypothetical protein
LLDREHAEEAVIYDSVDHSNRNKFNGLVKFSTGIKTAFLITVQRIQAVSQSRLVSNYFSYMYRQYYTIQTQHNIQFHTLYIQTGIEIKCHSNTKYHAHPNNRIEYEVILFPSWY